MPSRQVKRLIGGLAAGDVNHPNGNIVGVDSRSERPYFGYGTSGQTIRPLFSIIANNVTSVGNGADQTEDNLQTVSINAGALTAAGDAVELEAWGRTGANGDSKDVKLYFGATVVASALASTANAKNWYAYAIVYKTGSNAQLAFGYAQVDATAGSIQRSTPAETDTAAITVKTTGKENTANTANSIISDVLTVALV
jgi:hypothetical protein